MASYGPPSRNKPALYKPTDFARDHNRALVTNVKETKTEEKVVKKIQKRPQSQEEEKPGKVNISKIDSTNQFSEKGIVLGKGGAENKQLIEISEPGKNSGKGKNSQGKKKENSPIGVSQKDIAKIKQLQEFMAKQQVNGKGKDDTKDKKPDIKENAKKESKETVKIKTSADKEKKDVGSTKAKKKEKRAKETEKNNDKENKGNTTSNNKDKAQVKSKADKKNTSNSAGLKNKSNQHNQKSENQKSFNTKGPGGSYYSSNSFNPTSAGFSNDMSLLQMQYTVGAVGGDNNHSILGNPYNQMTDFKSPKDKFNQQNFPQNSPAPQSQIKKSDKSEKQKSLDFVKSFFDNDPEVQYNRRHNAEKQVSVVKSVSSDKASTLSISKHNTNTQNNLETIARNSIPQQQVKLQNSNTQPFMQNHAVQYEVNTSLPYSTAYSSSSYHHITDIPNSSHLQLNSHNSLQASRQPSFVHNTSALQQRMAQASLQHAMASSGSTIYGGMNQHSSLQHHQPIQQQQHASTSYHDTYSQMSHSGLSPGANPYGMLHQSSSGVSNSAINGYSMYSGYFPQGNHHSHVQRVEQQLDSNVMAKILQDQVKAKKWQETALNKCGPIDSSQARSLIKELISGTYECMVCCDSVKLNNAVWSCSNCYHIFHLNCIRKWARSEAAAVKDESGWRCPGCQNVSTRPPNKYYCFCGKVRDPDWNPSDGLTPHSCGEVCKKKRVNPSCEHQCNELCHPGPCPSCPVMVAKQCPCGNTRTKTRCGQVNPIKCDNTCSKLLNCGYHRCNRKCHEGQCGKCAVKYNEECFCSKEKRVVQCGSGEILPEEPFSHSEPFRQNYSCAQRCEKFLSCGNHSCDDICHAGPCKECPLLPKNLHYCPCGKHTIDSLLNDSESRTLCTDPVPTCDSFCGKKLNCGPKGLSHLCMMKCHNGPCRPCDKVTSVQCRCGGTKKDIACQDLKPGELVLCERKCNKKRKCGRHKCNQKCCIDREHNCNIICGKKLSCGTHRCEEVCHTGFCTTCWRAGFDELSCRCGNTVLYPPIPCGAKPPECDEPCHRTHACGHQPLHTCHNEETCPPCTVLTTKQCMGNHEIWKNVPCHLTEVSCGRKCGKVLKCGRHCCNKVCHKGPCLEENEKCTQPCPVKRKDCFHPCGAPCHTGTDCPMISCKAQVMIKCRCDRKSANAICLSGNANSAYQSFTAEMLSNQLHNLQSGHSIDISKLTGADKRPKYLECDEECARLERNKRLAEALGIENPEDGVFQPVLFSPNLRQEAKSHFQLVKMLEEVLENLITVAKKSSQGQAQHSFPPMNTSQRRLVHELADVYNCKTYSLDQEPKRNTVVLATKESYIPNIRLSTLTEREIMKPIPPQPMVLNQDNNPLLLGSPTSMKPLLKHGCQNQSAQKIDYFNDSFME